MDKQEAYDTVDSLIQSFQKIAEKNPATKIGYSTSESYMNLLEVTKRYCPNNELIKKLNPISQDEPVTGLLMNLIILQKGLYKVL